MELDQDVEAEQQQLVSSSSSHEASPEVVTGSSPAIADAECKSPSPVHGGIKCEYSAVGGGVERACESVGGGAKHRFQLFLSVGGAMRHSPAVGDGWCHVGGGAIIPQQSMGGVIPQQSACQSVVWWCHASFPSSQCGWCHASFPSSRC